MSEEDNLIAATGRRIHATNKSLEQTGYAENHNDGTGTLGNVSGMTNTPDREVAEKFAIELLHQQSFVEARGRQDVFETPLLDEKQRLVVAYLAGCEHKEKQMDGIMTSVDDAYPDDQSSDYRGGFTLCLVMIQRLRGKMG